jgi:predicted phage terminase large subunit-like protein
MKQIEIQKIINVMINDKRVRLSIVRKSPKYFFYFYFSHYAEYEIAPFQEEMFHISQDVSIRNIVIVGFRGCSKSTIFSLSFPLWAILGEQRLKHVVILSQTRQKAEMLLQQIKSELENNILLKKDLGPFREERSGWNAVSLHLTQYNAKITIASSEQSIRSLRHTQYRPQLIVADDLEDLESVKTIEGRDKTYNWFVGDVIPAGDKRTRIMVVGSLLHEDSLVKRLERSIAEGTMDGIYRAYSLLDEKGNPTWPGKFPNQKAVDDERKKGFSEAAWQREYLLRIIPDDSQVVYREWIQYYDYDKLPTNNNELRATVVGVDLAISQENNADYTAIVSALIYGSGENYRVYILPNPVNERLTFPQTIERLKIIHKSLNTHRYPKICVEDVGYQRAVIQQLENMDYLVEGTKVSCDKRSRLTTITHLIQQGKILFPAKGAERLISQLLGFGVEKHDDLVDAFTIVGHQAIKFNTSFTGIIWI